MIDIRLESCSVSYHAVNPSSEPGRTVQVGIPCTLRPGNNELDLHIHQDGETIEVVADVRSAVVFEGCTVELSHSFSPDELVLMNGYQSWTDTRERSPRDRMRGLSGIPKALVDQYVLDGGGDYRFVDYPNVWGRQHGFTYMTLRREDVGRSGGAGIALIGSLDERDGFSLIDIDARTGRIRIRKEAPLRAFEAGESVVLCKLAVIAARDVDSAYDRWFELMGVSALPARPLVGYTSWYRHYEDISAEKLRHDLAGAAAALESLGLGFDAPAPHAGRLFQIDDGYTVVGDWLDVDENKFPQGLAQFAHDIAGSGCIPGLWVAPFVCSQGSKLARDHPDWLLRDDAGGTVSTGSHWDGALALDTQNQRVRSYIEDVLRTMTAEWGFRLLKCDFLYAACMLPHGGLNRGQLMADGIDLIRGAVGPDVAILACGVPLGSVFGKVEYCRIGCDVGLDWDDKPHMRLLHRERVSTKRSLANTYGRAPLNGRAFANDPDVFFLRRDVRLTPAQRSELLDADARFGNILLTSDDMDTWGSGEREAFRRAVETLIGM